jgi:hypothetical protein
MSIEYYNAEEAMQKLNKPRSTFFKEVENGLIPFELEDGRQRGRRYPKPAIDILAQRQRRTRYKNEGPTHLIFSPSSLADLWAEVQIGTSLYGEDDIVPYEKLLDWRDINDEIFMCVKEQGQLVGYATLLPVDESIMLPLMKDTIRERDIPSKAIRQWTEPNLTVYVCSITVKPSGSAKVDATRGSFLIKNSIKWALSLNRQSSITKWFGIGASAEGQKLFESLGFTEVVSVQEGERKGYILEDVRKPVKLINMVLKEMEGQTKVASGSHVE